MAKGIPNSKLLLENADLRGRLAEAEETLRAIRTGDADAILITGSEGEKVHLLGAVDRVYREFLETSRGGTVTVTTDGKILGCNAALATTLQQPLEKLLGSKLQDHVISEDVEAIDSLLKEEDTGASRQIVHLMALDGESIEEYLSSTRLESSDAEPVSCLQFTDMREVVSAEQTLRESEKHYKELLDLAPVGICVVADGKVVFVNPEGTRLLGADSEEQIINKPAEQLIHPGSLERAQSDMTGLLAGDAKIFRREDTVLKLDGTSIAAEILATPLQYMGRPAIQVIFTDITERKREEAALEFRNILLTTQQEVSLDAILVVDEGAHILSYNRKFVEMWDIPAEVIDGNVDEPVLSYVSAQVADTEEFLRRVKFLYEHPTETSHDELLLKDGRVIDRNSAPMIGPDGKFLGRVWYFRDITERKLAETEHELLMSAIEQAVETVIITDPEGNIEYVNPAFEKMTGYTQAETVGKNPRILKSGEQSREFYRELWETISSGRTWTGVLVNKDKAGKTYTVESTITPVRDGNGRIVNYVEVNHDVSAQLLMEARLRQAQKMETVGQLAGGVAHDFNNMLQVIITYTDMSLTLAEVGERLHKYLLEIRRAAQRSAEMTGQLLAFARKQTIAPKIVDLNDSVASAQKMIQRLIGEDVDLAWMPGRDLWKLKIDPTQLDQILANLAVNARDAIGGVGKLTIGTQKIALDEEYCSANPGAVPGEYLLLTVSDDGCGMDKKTQSRLFEPFFTTKEPGKGTGLGLATVYGIVKQNNGFISVYSEPGEGTTFKLYLPRAEKAIGEDAAELEPEYRKGGTETVLVVEDETAILELARESLVQLGYSVLTAGSPEEAIRRAEEHAGPIHLLIADVVMPQMNGRRLAERLIAVRPQLKCIFMSGYTADVMGHREILTEEMKFIAKPFSLTVLAEKVREVIDG